MPRQSMTLSERTMDNGLRGAPWNWTSERSALRAMAMTRPAPTPLPLTSPTATVSDSSVPSWGMKS